MTLLILIHKSVLISIEVGILLGSLGAVSFVNTVNSAFSLGLVFTCISLFYFVLNADFVAAAQLLVYVGAINVLTLFAVMITDESAGSYAFADGAGSSIAFGACAILSSLLISMIHNTNWFSLTLPDVLENSVLSVFENHLQQLGCKLLSDFVIPFELVSMLLLAALVGAINLARDDKTFPDDEKSALLPPRQTRQNSSFFF
uniref:NAD(P)H-quinone oxidoreductase subunit 6, chloroplastic n=1 Tax=Antrophyum semicostatum TaxID=1604141 RepID=A0A3G5CTT5_9MONI|nr:NADH-plastoquinone oxidoreductase subunit 6 [Antrophyum semicostatum]AYW16300.1 NADH-plastoquinone oxidoreductase subunit 6 [Antrophyum semicostatum]